MSWCEIVSKNIPVVEEKNISVIEEKKITINNIPHKK